MVRALAAAAPCTGKQQFITSYHKDESFGRAAVLACSNALRLLTAAALAAAAAAAAAAALAGSVQSTPPAPDLRRYDALSRLSLTRFRGAETALLA